tara:strand:- start:104 stop:613 length:510 start_codon:yes stop_codon:yes gene_type:complete
MSTLDIKKFVGNFSRNLGNGIAMGQNTLDAVNHAIKTGDTSIIAMMLDKIKSKKDGANNFELTIRSIWAGVSINIDKKTNQYRIKTKNATLSNSAVEILNQLVADNVSMRGNKWASAFSTNTEVKDFDPVKYAQGIAKRNPERINAMIAALQVVQKELDNKKVLDKVAA